jgi:Predicted phosphoribosyltransferases
MGTLNIIFGIVTVLSLLVTIYYGRKASILETQKKKLDWSDIQTCANDLGDRIKQDNFIPDLIFTPGLRAASFVSLLETEFNNINIPTFVGMSFWKSSSFTSTFIANHERLETNKWQILVPEAMLNLTDKKILVVDDFAMSGDFIISLKHLLINKGFKNENIKTATIAVTKVAKANKKCPDYYWIETNDNSFYFPWGKAK